MVMMFYSPVLDDLNFFINHQPHQMLGLNFLEQDLPHNGTVAKQPKFSGISEIQLKLVNFDRKQAHFHRFLWEVGLNCDF